jgi:hypothetical protein
MQITASIRHRNIRSLLSNSATVKIYNLISLRGPGVIPRKVPENSDESSTLVESGVSVMESCSIVLEVQGGPPNLKSRVIANPGDGVYFNTNKVGERIYQI